MSTSQLSFAAYTFLKFAFRFSRASRNLWSQPVNSSWRHTHFEIWLSRSSRVYRIFQSQLVNHQIRRTLPRIRRSRGNNVETRDINLRQAHINQSTAVCGIHILKICYSIFSSRENPHESTISKFGLLDFLESLDFSKVNLSTTKNDIPFPESEALEKIIQGLKK